MSRTQRKHAAVKHGLFLKGAMLCDFCKKKRSEICPQFQPGKSCYFEEQEMNSVNNIREAETKLQFEVAREIIRLITRLKIALTFGEVNMRLQNQVLNLAVSFLKILDKRAVPGGIKKDLATLLAEAKKKKKEKNETNIH